MKCYERVRYFLRPAAVRFPRACGAIYEELRGTYARLRHSRYEGVRLHALTFQGRTAIFYERLRFWRAPFYAQLRSSPYAQLRFEIAHCPLAYCLF